MSQGQGSSHSSQIAIDFYLFEAKLTAELYTFSSPGAFATVELKAEGEPQGPRLKLFFKDVAYATALAHSINGAGVGAGASAGGKTGVIYTKHLHTEHECRLDDLLEKAEEGWDE